MAKILMRVFQRNGADGVGTCGASSWEDEIIYSVEVPEGTPEEMVSGAIEILSAEKAEKDLRVRVVNLPAFEMQGIASYSGWKPEQEMGHPFRYNQIEDLVVLERHLPIRPRPE